MISVPVGTPLYCSPQCMAETVILFYLFLIKLKSIIQ